MEGSRIVYRRRLSVTSVWGSKRSHKFLGKSGATPASTDLKWVLRLQIALSTALLR